HPQMDLGTDEEVHDYVTTTYSVFDQHKEVLNREIEPIEKDNGLYAVLFKKNDVDFVLEFHNTSQSQKLETTEDDLEDGKELGGVLLGHRVHPYDHALYPVIDRELTELYAVITPSGLNHWYLISRLLIFGGFAVFIFVVAKRSKRKEHK